MYNLNNNKKMEEQKNISADLQKCNVETYDTTEMTIVACIRRGINTISAIADETAIKENYVKNVIANLVSGGVLLEVPGEEENTFMIKYKGEQERKKLRLAGNLILPVSTFYDSKGQKWVTRGTWHPIDEGVDILNDIEWYEDTNNETQMKSVMKMVTEKKRTDNSKSAAVRIKEQGEAPEEIKKLIDWIPLNDFMKMKVMEGGANESIVTVSPRLITESGIEFPWGTAVVILMSNEDILAYASGEKKYEKKYQLDDLVTNFKKILALKSCEGNVVTFTDFLIKKKQIIGFTKTYDVVTKKDKKLGQIECKDYETLKNLLETEYPLFMDIINKYNESVSE